MIKVTLGGSAIPKALAGIKTSLKIFFSHLGKQDRCHCKQSRGLSLNSLICPSEKKKKRNTIFIVFSDSERLQQH